MRMLGTILATLLLGLAPLAQAGDGFVAVKSPLSAADTMTKLEQTVLSKGLKVFARIDHAAGAKSIDKTLRPTEVIIFGNPKGGTPLMECQQTLGIELPLKALVWQDAGGQVWLGYNDPVAMAARHEAANCPVAGNLRKALEGISAAVVGP